MIKDNSKDSSIASIHCKVLVVIGIILLVTGIAFDIFGIAPFAIVLGLSVLGILVLLLVLLI